jgi:hypothetical protein
MISIFVSVIGVALALGLVSNAYVLIIAFISAMFIVIGNYMPKTTRNVTMGIKIKWTMANDENWNATHRFCGKLYVIIGFLSLVAMFLPSDAFPFVALALILIVVILPIIYSYAFYKKQLEKGEVTRENYKTEYAKLVGDPKKAKIITGSLVGVLIIIMTVFMFSGNLEFTLDDASIAVKSSFTADFAYDYADIVSAELRNDVPVGTKVVGFNSAKLLLGDFRNSEFGMYERYTYTQAKTCIVMTIEGGVVVIGAETDEETMAMFDKISAEISK